MGFVLQLSSNTTTTRWETHLRPRTMGLTNSEDIFGDVDGLIRVQRGWLTEEVDFGVFGRFLKT